MLMKLVTINNHRIHMPLMTLRGLLSQRSRSASYGHSNFVNSIAAEPLKEFELKLMQIFPTVGPQTD